MKEKLEALQAKLYVEEERLMSVSGSDYSLTMNRIFIADVQEMLRDL